MDQQETYRTYDMTVDAAQQMLGDAGYDVQVDTDTGMIVADMTRGLHYAVVSITPGHACLVTQWWSATPDAIRSQTCEYWPGSVRATVECARDVAAAVALSHAADVRQAQAAQVPAFIAEQIAAELAGKAPDDEPVIDAEQTVCASGTDLRPVFVEPDSAVSA